SRKADGYMQRVCNLARQVLHGLRTHFDYFPRNASLTGRCIGLVAKVLSGDCVRTKDLDFLSSKADRCDFFLMLSGTGGCAGKAELVAGELFHRERPGIAAWRQHNFLVLDINQRLRRVLVRALMEAPLRAGRILAPPLGAACMAYRGLGLSLLSVFPLNKTAPGCP